MTATYESVLEKIKGVARASSGDQRDVHWLSEAQVVGVARDRDGRVEVFLAGAELHPNSTMVRAAIEFHTWYRTGAPSFDANRLVFPSRGHFDQVAAFVCTELLRGGAEVSLEQAFSQTEPIIELAIERIRLSNQAILGLAGELLLLDAVCRQAREDQLSSVLDAWDGWRRSSRDFTWGCTGVEVKTTTRSGSSHLVEGIHQVELNDGYDGGVAEDRLFLVSIGLQPTLEHGGNSFTIPELVEGMIQRLEGAGIAGSVAETFVAHVAEYGAQPGGGYRHGTENLDPAYMTPFLTSFFRGYDMSDTAVEVLRREDIAVRQHVDVGSVRFRVELPVAGSVGNPVAGANQVARAILSAGSVSP